MTSEEAVRGCEFWSENVAGNVIFGTTRDPAIGLYFDGEEYQAEAFSDPSKKGWAIKVPRYVKGGQVETALYRMIVQEIERRGAQ